MRSSLKKMLADLSSDRLLKNSTYENTPTYSLLGMRCKGKVLKVYDGDTVWLAIPVPDKIYKYRARLYGYDSAEMKSSAEEEVQKAIQAKKKIQDLTCDGVLLDVELLEYDKYGRILVKLYRDGVCINDQMVQEGFGKPYFGGHKD